MISWIRFTQRRTFFAALGGDFRIGVTIHGFQATVSIPNTLPRIEIALGMMGGASGLYCIDLGWLHLSTSRRSTPRTEEEEAESLHETFADFGLVPGGAPGVWVERVIGTI
jgi:hypothetical protein